MRAKFVSPQFNDFFYETFLLIISILNIQVRDWIAKIDLSKEVYLLALARIGSQTYYYILCVKP